MAEQEELALGLWNGTISGGGGWGACSHTTENATEMVLTPLDCAIRYVLPMVICWQQLVGHVGFPDLLFVRFRYFIVQNLVHWNNTLDFHL